MGLLERHAYHEADAMLVGSGQVEVAETADVLHVYNLKYIVYACRHLPVGFLRVHHVGAFGEVHQRGVARVLAERGVVLVAEVTP